MNRSLQPAENQKIYRPQQLLGSPFSFYGARRYLQFDSSIDPVVGPLNCFDLLHLLLLLNLWLLFVGKVVKNGQAEVDRHTKVGIPQGNDCGCRVHQRTEKISPDIATGYVPVSADSA
jgi:hypothetical protein